MKIYSLRKSRGCPKKKKKEIQDNQSTRARTGIIIDFNGRNPILLLSHQLYRQLHPSNFHRLSSIYHKLLEQVKTSGRIKVVNAQLYEIYTGASSNPPPPHMKIHFFLFKNQYGSRESRAHHILIMSTPYIMCAQSGFPISAQTLWKLRLIYSHAQCFYEFAGLLGYSLKNKRLYK